MSACVRAETRERINVARHYFDCEQAHHQFETYDDETRVELRNMHDKQLMKPMRRIYWLTNRFPLLITILVFVSDGDDESGRRSVGIYIRNRVFTPFFVFGCIEPSAHCKRHSVTRCFTLFILSTFFMRFYLVFIAVSVISSSTPCTHQTSVMFCT